MTATATVVGSFVFGGGGLVESRRRQWRELLGGGSLKTTMETVVGSFEFGSSGVFIFQRRQRRQSLGLSCLAVAASLNLDDDNGESCWAAAALLNLEDADGDSRWVFRDWQQRRR